jgi:hypothetical protein
MVSEVEDEADAEADLEADLEADADADVEVELKKTSKIALKSVITEPVVSKIKKIKKTSVADEPVADEPVAVITNLTKIVLPKKIGLKEIQDIVKEYGIDILKKSDKTEKMLKKTIDELRDELMEKYG